MKHTGFGLAVLSLLVVLSALQPARALFVANDDCESYAVGPLNAANGGAGFGGGYTAKTDANVVAKTMAYSNDQVIVDGGTRCIRITNPDNVAFTRPITPQSGSALYMSFLFETSTADGGSNEDFLSLGLVNQANETTAGVVHRFNGGSGADKDHAFALRAAANSEGKMSVGGTEPNRTYFVVYRLTKSVPGDASNYDQMALFVDPATTNEPASPTITYDLARWPTATHLGCRIALSETGDTYDLDNLRVGTTYKDVVLPLEATEQVVPPQFSPPGGRFTNSVDVTITTVTPGATIRYTTDNTIPSALNGTTYTGPVTLTHATVMRAIGTKAGSMDSAVNNATYAPDADLTVREDFEDLALGVLNGQSGGENFLAPWTSLPSGVEVVSHTMEYAQGPVRVSGGGKALRVLGVNTGNATFDGVFYPHDADELYMSLLLQNTSAYTDDDFFYLGFGTTGAAQPTLGLLHRGNVAASAFLLGLRHNTLTDAPSTFATTANQTYFVVVRLSKGTPGANNGYNQMKLYVNPTTLTEPATPTHSVDPSSQGAAFNHLVLRTANLESDDAYYVDNLRVGRTYESVVPPSPYRGTAVMIW